MSYSKRFSQGEFFAEITEKALPVNRVLSLT